MRKFTFALLVLSAIAYLPLCPAQTPPSKRPMTFEDMMNMKRLGETAVSPDGKWLAYSVTTINLDQNAKTTEWWVQAIAGGEPAKLAVGQPGDSGIEFAPDGHSVLFLSGRDGGQQIWIADFDAATGTASNAKKLTTIATEADNAKWSPDGHSIVFTSAVYPDCPAITPAEFDTGNKCNADRDAAQAASKVKAQIFTHLLYRHWNHYTGDKRSHLFIVTVDDGKMRDLNPNDPHEVPPDYPTDSLGCGCAISPDGKELAFTENLDPIRAISTNADIFTLDLTNATAKPVKVSTSPGGDFSPAYSPDGKYLAWRSQARAGYEGDKFRLMLYDRAAKTIKDLLPKFDRWVDEFKWDTEQAVYITAEDEGEQAQYMAFLGPDQRFEQPMESPNFKGCYDWHFEGSGIIATCANVRQPGEVFMVTSSCQTKTCNSNAAKTTQVTHLNDELLAQLDLPAQEPFWFTAADKTKLQGFIVRPPAFDARKEISSQVPHPRRPAGRVGRLVELSLERRTLRRQRLRRCHDQPARVHRIWAGHR